MRLDASERAALLAFLHAPTDENFPTSFQHANRLPGDPWFGE